MKEKLMPAKIPKAPKVAWEKTEEACPRCGEPMHKAVNVEAEVHHSTDTVLYEVLDKCLVLPQEGALMKYPNHVTSHEAVRLMMRLEGLENIVNGDAWFTIDVDCVPVLQGFVQRTEETNQEDILYRYETDDSETTPDGFGLWKKKRPEEVSL